MFPKKSWLSAAAERIREKIPAEAGTPGMCDWIDKLLRPDGSLMGTGFPVAGSVGHYIRYSVGAPSVSLDGDFTALELEHIVKIMKRQIIRP